MPLNQPVTFFFILAAPVFRVSTVESNQFWAVSIPALAAVSAVCPPAVSMPSTSPVMFPDLAALPVTEATPPTYPSPTALPASVASLIPAAVLNAVSIA